MTALPPRVPYLSVAFGVSLVVAFILGHSTDPLELAERYGFSLSDPSLPRSISYVFVHGGAGHLLLNLVLLAAFATFSEVYGRRTLWPAVALAGAVIGAYGELLVAIVTGAARTGVLVGASGAISAMAGWSFALGAREREPDLLTRLVRSAAVGWLALQAVAILLVTRQAGPSATAYWAHLWGFVAGGTFGALTRPAPSSILRRASALIRGNRPADALALLTEPMEGLAEQERLELIVQAWRALGDTEQVAHAQAVLVQACPTIENLQALVDAGGVTALSPSERLRLATVEGVSLQARVALLTSFEAEPKDVPGRASALLQLADLLRGSDSARARALLERVIAEYAGSEPADLAVGRLRALSS